MATTHQQKNKAELFLFVYHIDEHLKISINKNIETYMENSINSEVFYPLFPNLFLQQKPECEH